MRHDYTTNKVELTCKECRESKEKGDLLLWCTCWDIYVRNEDEAAKRWAKRCHRIRTS